MALPAGLEPHLFWGNHQHDVYTERADALGIVVYNLGTCGALMVRLALMRRNRRCHHCHAYYALDR